MKKIDVFTDYVSWKFENYTLVSDLVKKNSACISRFTHVIAVTDYLYDKYINNSLHLPEEEELIFETGFNYLFKRFETIEEILKTDFDNSVYRMNKFATTVNLVLYIDDFMEDLDNFDNTSDSLEELNVLEQKVYKYLSTKKSAPDTFFALVDDTVIRIYEELEQNYYGVNDIMYDIAIQYGLEVEKENEIDIFQNFMGHTHQHSTKSEDKIND